MHSKPLPAQAYLAKRFSYNAESGHIYHLIGPRSGCRAGSEHFRRDGSKNMRRLLGWLEHRVIWQLVHGSIPNGMVIDHINGDPFDNRLANLRCVTDRQSGLNRKLHKNNKTGHPGVTVTKAGRYRAKIQLHGKQTQLGTFETLDAAIEARRAAETEQGEHTRPVTANRVPSEREAQRCPTCGHLPRVLSPEQIEAGRERAHRQWLRRKELIASALGKLPS